MRRLHLPKPPFSSDFVRICGMLTLKTCESKAYPNDVTCAPVTS